MVTSVHQWPGASRAAVLLSLSVLLHAVLLSAMRAELDWPGLTKPRAEATIAVQMLSESAPAPASSPRPSPRRRAVAPPRASPAPALPAAAIARLPIVDMIPDEAPIAEQPLVEQQVAAPIEPAPAAPEVTTNEALPAIAPAKVGRDLLLELGEVGVDRDGLPANARWVYRTTDSRYGTVSGTTTINWRFDAATSAYETQLVTRVFGVPIADITSAGEVRRFGLAPLRYVQKTGARAPVAANFDWMGRQVTFSSRSYQRPLREGIQDRLSFQFQLMALAQRFPQAFREGAALSMSVAGTNDVEPYEFVVVGHEIVTTELGPIDAIKLERPKSVGSADTRIEVWLAPDRRWLPVRLRFTDRRNGVTESTLEAIGNAD